MLYPPENSGATGSKALILFTLHSPSQQPNLTLFSKLWWKKTFNKKNPTKQRWCLFLTVFVVALQEHWQPFVDWQKRGRLPGLRQLCDLIRARPGPAHPHLQPEGEPGHPPHQSRRHALHPAPPEVPVIPEYGCIQSQWTNLLTQLLPWFPAGLMTIHRRVLMTGRSWPPTPGTRTPAACGDWRLRMSPVPVTTVKQISFYLEN